MKNKTLLVWDRFGEGEIQFYLIPDAPEWLEKCNQKFIGGGYSDEVQDLVVRVGDAVQPNRDYMVNSEDALAGEWVSMKLDLVSVMDIGKVRVVVSGAVP